MRNNKIKKRTLIGILKALADGQSAQEIARRFRSVNTQQIGAIITNVQRNVYDDEHLPLVRKILTHY